MSKENLVDRTNDSGFWQSLSILETKARQEEKRLMLDRCPCCNWWTVELIDEKLSKLHLGRRGVMATEETLAQAVKVAALKLSLGQIPGK